MTPEPGWKSIMCQLKVFPSKFPFNPIIHSAGETLSTVVEWNFLSKYIHDLFPLTSLFPHSLYQLKSCVSWPLKVRSFLICYSLVLLALLAWSCPYSSIRFKLFFEWKHFFADFFQLKPFFFRFLESALHRIWGQTSLRR